MQREKLKGIEFDYSLATYSRGKVKNRIRCVWFNPPSRPDLDAEGPQGSAVESLHPSRKCQAMPEQALETDSGRPNQHRER